MSKTVKIALACIVIIAAIVWGYFLFRGNDSEKYVGPMEKLAIGSPYQKASALVYLAKTNGYFEENALDVEIIRYHFGFAAIQGLLKNEVDIAFATDFAFVSSYFDTDELRILCSIAEADVEELIARKDSGIHKIEDLKGKTIGIKKKSSGEFHLHDFLTRHGISIENVNIIDLRPPDLVEAVATKKADATVIWPPHAYTLKNELGDNAIGWSAQSGQEFFWLMVTTEEKLKQKRLAFKRFLECLLRSEAFLRKEEATAKQIVKGCLDSTDAYMDYHWPKHIFTVELPQSLLYRLEDEARWRIKNNLTSRADIPNYLDVVRIDLLDETRPEAVTIIR